MSSTLKAILQLPKAERLRIAIEILRSVQAEEEQATPNPSPERVLRGYGKFAGKIWMSDDFDAPLDDFKEYM